MQRRILVNSWPEGALVTIDKQVIGHTPCAIPFTYYGTREIELEKDGFKTVKVKQRFLPPWYQYPPLDFITDNFWPQEIRDQRNLEFHLEPLEAVNEQQLLERAGQMRGNVHRGTVPLPTAAIDPLPNTSAGQRTAEPPMQRMIPH